MISRVATALQTIVMLSQSSVTNEEEAGIMEVRSGMLWTFLSTFTESFPSVTINSLSGKGLVFCVPKETLGRKTQITVMLVLFSLN